MDRTVSTLSSTGKHNRQKYKYHKRHEPGLGTHAAGNTDEVPPNVFSLMDQIDLLFNPYYSNEETSLSRKCVIGLYQVTCIQRSKDKALLAGSTKQERLYPQVGNCIHWRTGIVTEIMPWFLKSRT